jgi:hypothetical protein
MLDETGPDVKSMSKSQNGYYTRPTGGTVWGTPADPSV